jgi:hypothetical protein
VGGGRGAPGDRNSRYTTRNVLTTDAQNSS